jgi:hypothetical protein
LYIPVAEYYGPRFDGSDYAGFIDHWAYLLELTGYCESQNFFNVVNTYDRAKFTFGFYQMAAHTPKDNLILFFRSAVKAGELAGHFPDLNIVNGRLHRMGKDGTTTDLEAEFNTGPQGEAQLQLFMNYLNPNRWQVDEQEVLQSARLIHGVLHDASLRKRQVQTGVDILSRKMQTYAKWYDLDGQTDVVCGIIADIHHQGRGTRNTVRNALKAADKVEALIAIGSKAYPNRSKDLAEKLKEMKDSGKLGSKRYDEALNEFH